MTWFPISTAPNDGRPIAVLTKENNFPAVRIIRASGEYEADMHSWMAAHEWDLLLRIIERGRLGRGPARRIPASRGGSP